MAQNNRFEHYLYSHNITCHDLNIITYGIHNGDGIDPDSSTDCYIFNCVFDTGDDCIAIKSGKNPEGYVIAKATRDVRISDCDFKRGHGISIGSEMSGGVRDVLVQDCRAGALLDGFQIKGTKPPPSRPALNILFSGISIYRRLLQRSRSSTLTASMIRTTG